MSDTRYCTAECQRRGNFLLRLWWGRMQYEKVMAKKLQTHRTETNSAFEQVETIIDALVNGLIA